MKQRQVQFAPGRCLCYDGKTKACIKKRCATLSVTEVSLPENRRQSMEEEA